MIEDFISWKRAGGIAETTLRQRRLALERFDRFAPLDTATHAHIIEYLHDGGRKAASNRCILAALRTFYAWANATGHLDHDPTALVHPIREPHSIPRPTPLARITRALETSPHDVRLMILLGWRAGLRLSEIASLHARDITDDGLRITGKGSRQRRIPAHADLAPLLDFTGWAFPSQITRSHVHPDFIHKRVTAATGHTTHGLRHRFATDVYKATKDLQALRLLMGHSSIQTTQRYVQLADDALRDAIAAI